MGSVAGSEGVAGVESGLVPAAALAASRRASSAGPAAATSWIVVPASFDRAARPAIPERLSVFAASRAAITLVAILASGPSKPSAARRCEIGPSRAAAPSSTVCAEPSSSTRADTASPTSTPASGVAGVPKRTVSPSLASAGFWLSTRVRTPAAAASKAPRTGLSAGSRASAASACAISVRV